MDEDYKKIFAQCNQEDQDYYQKMQETLDNNIIIRQERWAIVYSGIGLTAKPLAKAGGAFSLAWRNLKKW